MAEEAIRSDPTNKRARYDLSIGYTKMGDVISARIRMRPPHATWQRSKADLADSRQMGCANDRFEGVFEHASILKDANNARNGSKVCSKRV